MNVKVRGMVACVSSLIILASIAAMAVAQTPGKSLKDQVVGHWQLASVSIGGNDPYGDKPQGSMFLDAGGHYSVIVLGGGQENTIAYFGTYTINDADSTMTLHIDGSSRPNADGRDLKRIITFSGDELITDTPPSVGRTGTVKLTWKRS
jgi:Lipocalin-like domain